MNLPIGIILLVGLCLVVLIVMVGMALFSFIFRAGVAVSVARKPAHTDTGDYYLEQGREVRAEGGIQRGTENTDR